MTLPHKDFEKSYNERLFSKGLRKKFHLARYYWLMRQIHRLQAPTHKVVELGCFDAKTLDFFDKTPEYYVGYDANWENALDIARKKWANHPNVVIKESQVPAEMDVAENEFDISICLETLEHIHEEYVEGYIQKLALATQKYCFISVPNEKGLFFLTKKIFKTLKGTHTESYTFSEIINATLGRMDKVKRQQGGHKGFDYKTIEKLLLKYFKTVETVGIPYASLPVSANFSVGFIAYK